MAMKCTVRFKRYTWGSGPRGIVATLNWRGRVLNSVTFPPSHIARHGAPTVKQLREARRGLMRGCAELVRDEQRRQRRKRR